MKAKYTIIFAAAILLGLSSVVGAVAGRAYRMGVGVQMAPQSEEPTKESLNGSLYIDSTASDALTYCKPSGGGCSAVGSGGGSSYNQTIQDEGSGLTQRSILNFAGAGVSCADDATKTTCTISGGGSTGNYTFSSDTMDLSGAAVMSSAPTTATGITLGQHTTLAAGKVLQAASGNNLVLAADANAAGGRITLQNIGAASPGLYFGNIADNAYIFSGAGPVIRIRPGTTGTEFSAGAVNPETAAAQTLGASGLPFLHVAVGAAAGSQQACNSNTRGAVMVVFATAGNSDTLQVCMKAAADTYAWRTVYTAP
jgi:hypothetical protein